MRLIRSLGIFALVIIVCMALMPLASAHRVHLQEQIGTIEVKAWFGGGDPMINGDVEVYAIKDGQEELYLNGKTDEDGVFSFTPKIGITKYRVVAQESGHKGETVIDLTGSVQQDAELPLYMRIVAGFGFLIGLAGAGMLFVGWKWKKQYEGK